jgi:hypothetical protein
VPLSRGRWFGRFFALAFDRFFALAFGLIFTAPFRLVTALEIACLWGFLGIGPGFECFGNFGIRMAVCLRPALLKGRSSALLCGYDFARSFTHREQECPSRTGSVSRECIDIMREAGIPTGLTSCTKYTKVP